MFPARLRTVANVARRASLPVRAHTAGFSQAAWDVNSLLNNASKQLDPALYLVATPLGNLEDITLRALRVLQLSDVIYSEDCRHTSKLTNHYGITTTRVSYHQHNEAKRNSELVDRLKQGQTVALVSDAGCPGISDPGASAVVAAISAGCKVVPIPGASAVLTGLLGSGLPTEQFHFVGFLPPKNTARRQAIEQLNNTITATMVFYVPPHKLLRVLTDMQDVMGGERRCCVARELTKVHETFLRGPLHDIRRLVEEHGARGEVTLLVEGSKAISTDAGRRPAPATETMGDRVSALLEGGMSTREAAKVVSGEMNVRKKDVYAEALRLQQK